VAAVIAGVRFGIDGAVAIVNRSALFEADVMLSTVEAGLPPDETQTEAIGRAAATLPPTGRRDAPLLGASLGVLPGSTMMANVYHCAALAFYTGGRRGARGAGRASAASAHLCFGQSPLRRAVVGRRWFKRSGA
jgi:hypothetical protein